MAIKPIQGTKKVLFFQAMDDTTVDGNSLRLAFQTEHTLTMEREELEEITKDGTLKDTGDINASIDLTAYVASGDATYDLLKRSFKKNETLQVWEVDVTEETTSGKYEAVYAQGKLTNFEQSSSADGYAELSTTIAVNLTPQDGEVSLTPDEFTAVQYAFKDFGELASEAEGDTTTQE